MSRFILIKRLVTATALALSLTSALVIAPVRASPTSEAQKDLDQALALEKSGKIKDAMDHLKDAVSSDPDFLPARFELGLLYLRRGSARKAEVELEAVRAKGFDEEKIALPLIRAYLAQGKY